MNDIHSPGSWHVARWHPLAWLETFVKLIAILIGINSGLAALTSGVFTAPRGTELVQFTILVLLSIGLVAAIADRYLSREVIAMIFVFANNLGHWGMVVALAAGAAPITAFAGLMLLGDVVKLIFIRVSGFTVRDVPRSALYGLTGIYIAGYAIILLLEWLG